MDNASIFKEIKTLLADQLDINIDTITTDSNLTELGCSTLIIENVVIFLEEKYQLSVPIGEDIGIIKAGDFLKLLVYLNQ